MKYPQMKLAIITICFITHSKPKIMRNNALMTKMMSHFQKDNNLSNDPEPPPPPPHIEAQGPSRIMALMQNVLCRNFPTIPCKMIMKDDTLKNLIEKSIQQLTYKKYKMESTTPFPNFGLTLFPIINSEDLSNFLQVSNTGYFSRKRKENKKKKASPLSEPKTLKNFWSHEKLPKNVLKLSKDNNKHTDVYNRKKLRKFYPHKIKYKDKKNANNQRVDFREYSDEKLSMSVELPDMTNSMHRNQQRMTYNAEQAEPPVWRIDYMKHGEPSLNMFAYEDDRLRGKIMKTGPSVIVDEAVLEQAARKDVLHPDVYIKKNHRKNTVNVNSDGGE